MYKNFPVIRAIRLQTEIAISNMEAEYIAFSRAMTDVLPFLVLSKILNFLLELQHDALKVLHSIFEKRVTVQEDNQEEISLVVAP